MSRFNHRYIIYQIGKSYFPFVFLLGQEPTDKINALSSDKVLLAQGACITSLDQGWHCFRVPDYSKPFNMADMNRHGADEVIINKLIGWDH